MPTMHPIHINSLSIHWVKGYLPLLKMVEELIGNLGYDETPQAATKHQKLLKCILTGNSKLYLGEVYTEEQLTKLSEEEVEKLFNNYDLSYWARW